MASKHCIFYLIVMSVRTTEATELSEGVRSFNSELDHIKENIIGVTTMQNLIDEVKFRDSKLDGNHRINQLADYIAKGFGDRFDAIRRIRDVAVSLYENETLHDQNAPIQYCCELDPSELEYNPDYGIEVSTNKLCLRASTRTPEDAILPNSEKLLEVFKENTNREGLESLKWQYIGTEQGVTLAYPAHQEPKECGSYDPRFRPWYAEAATTIPKDVVIVMDRSDSMRNDNKLHISQEAAKTVVDTLNPNDKVGLVLFSSGIKRPEGNGENCYQSELAYATPDVKTFFKEYINDITLKDSTHYIPALDAAFDYFTVDDARRMVILFLTDGSPHETDGRVLDRLSELNAAKQNKVLILTFGLGNDVKDDLLKDMAEMNRYNASAGPVTKGEYTHITNNEDLRYQMASYYNYFASIEHLDQPITTVPYVDFSALGHIFSICLPIAGNDANADTDLLGVACIDMTLSDITNEFEYLQRSSNAYVFIIDSNGRTLLHPMLPIPGFDSRSDPLYVDIEYFEPEANSAGILDSMKRLTDGNETIEATIITNRGFAPLHGVENEKLETTYIWRAVEGTHFSVAIVVTDRDVDLRIETMKVANTFTYHQFCDIAVCANKEKESTIEYGTAQLSSRAFKENSIERAGCEFGREISEYMTDSQRQSDKLNEGIRELYGVISEMIPIWTDSMNQYNDVIYERFIASHSGIFTVYPGTTMSDDYDHTTTDWYNTAYSNKDQLVFTPPRSNEFGRQNVVTIAHTMLEGKVDAHSMSDLTIGVIGMNVGATFMEVYLRRSIQQCSEEQFRCMLMDTAGFLIYHPDAKIHYKHIAQLEPEIASDLIRESNTPIIHRCDDFAWKLQYSTWHFDIEDGLETSFYQVVPFSGKNVLLIIRDLTAFTTPRTCDSCNMTSYISHDGTPKCNRVDSMTCNCPCYSELYYDPCKNRFGIETSFPICSKPVFPDQNPITKVNISTAQPCYSTECTTYANEFDCILRPECDWYPVATTDGITCFRKGSIVITDTPPAKQISNSEESDSSNTGAIVGSIFAVLFLLALVVVGIFLFLKFRNKEPPKFIADNDAYTPSDNEIYDELHYVVPSRVSRTTATSTSTDSTELGTPSRAVGLLNPAFRQSLPETDFNGIPVVEPVTSPIQYNTVLTSQYLTHSSVGQITNNDRPQSELQPQTYQPPNTELQLVPQPMSYHGSYKQNELEDQNNNAPSEQLVKSLDKSNNLEPPWRLDENAQVITGQYREQDNNDNIHDPQVKESCLDDQPIDYSTCLKHTPRQLEERYIGQVHPSSINEAIQSVNDQGGYLPIDKNSAVEHTHNIGLEISQQENAQLPYTLEQQPYSAPPTIEHFPSEHADDPVNHIGIRNVHDDSVNINTNHPNRIRRQTFPEGCETYTLHGHISLNSTPNRSHSLPQHPASFPENNHFTYVPHSAMPSTRPDNGQLQFVPAKPPYIRGQETPKEHSDSRSSRDSVFSSYI